MANTATTTDNNNTIALQLAIGAAAMLLSARAIVPSDDPGRLNLTTSGGTLSFQLFVYVALAIIFVLQSFFRLGRRLTWVDLVLPVGVVLVGIVAWVSGAQGERYARPGRYIGWEWLSLAMMLVVIRLVCQRRTIQNGLINVILASIVSIAGLGIYQAASPVMGLPKTEVEASILKADSLGRDEFANRIADETMPRVHGTFTSAGSLVALAALGVPLLMVGIFSARQQRLKAAGLVVMLLGLIITTALAGFHESFARELNGTLKHLPGTALGPWGIGPGNFPSEFPLSERQPGNTIAGLISTHGWLALGTILAAIALVGWKVFQQPVDEESALPIQKGTRWEYYGGAIAGLLFGVIWTSSDLPADTPADQTYAVAVAAIVRGAIWFSAFGLLEAIKIDWLQHRRLLALGIGWWALAALVLEGGAVPGLIGLGFGLAVLLLPSGAQGLPNKVVAIGGAISALTGGMIFLALAAAPGWRTAEAARNARTASIYLGSLELKIATAGSKVEQNNEIAKARGYLLANIINPLNDAATKDPGHAALLRWLSIYERRLYNYELTMNPKEAAKVAKTMLGNADKASSLEPKNIAGHLAVYDGLMTMRTESNTNQAERNLAISNRITKIAEIEPTQEVPLRWKLIDLVMAQGEQAYIAEEITTILRLNRVPGQPHGRLTADQKTDLIERGKKRLVKIPDELIKEWVQD